MMKGKVYLVGAGPGDYKLITLKGLEAIRGADVIVYDRLANKALLREAKSHCEMIYVGKKANRHTMKQEDINALLVQKALEGKVVTRLKGGDPYVFGRGGEEGQSLQERAIDFEVIPGITSAIGGLCYGGIPITHRDYASSFHVITGHLKNEAEDPNWQALVHLKGTLVFLMGMSNLEKIVKKLLEHGKSPDTPVAIINWATTPNQKVVTDRLDSIYDLVHREKIQSPSLIVVGDVVKLRSSLNFFEGKPLFNKQVVITRSRAQSSKLTRKISELGGYAVEFPTIKINPIEPNHDLLKAIREMDTYDYLILTSENGVSVFFDTLYKEGYDGRKLGPCKIVAIGRGTARRLWSYGLRADIIPESYVGEEVFKCLKDSIKSGDRALIPHSKNARPYLVEAVSELCSVHEVKTYETLLGDGDREELLEKLKARKIDYVTFTSSSTVKNFVTMLGKKHLKLLKNVKLISIGPITSNTIEALGLKVEHQAKEHTIDGILECLQQDVKE